MSATKPRRELASPDSRRRPGSRRPKSQRVPLFDAQRRLRARVAGGRDSTSPRPAPGTHARNRTPARHPARDLVGVPAARSSAPAPGDSARCGR